MTWRGGGAKIVGGFTIENRVTANMDAVVLVVEDDPHVQQFIGATVGSARPCVYVSTVASGLEAVSAARFDLVLLDIALCDGRGMQILRAMRAKGDKTPVIVISGLATWSEACEMDHLDVAARFAKPHLERLRAKVEEVLTASRDACDLLAVGVGGSAEALAATKVEQLAQRAGLSPSGLSRRFKSRFGVGARAYIAQRRLERVKALLMEGGFSVAQIADALGFCEASHLSRWFKRLAGCTPVEFRESHRRPNNTRGANVPRPSPV